MKQAKRRVGLYLGCTAVGFGLISMALWGKMRFVTNLPRMAYAVPEGEPSPAHDEPAQIEPAEPNGSEEIPPENAPPETGGN